MSSLTAPPTPPPHRFHAAVWLFAASILCLLAAAGVAATLALGERALPGCGGGDGCGAVLASRWAWVGPVPVSAVGLAAYLAATGVVGGLLVSAVRDAPPSGLVVGVFYFLTTVILGGILWFVYLQAVEIGAFCKYCTAAHVLGGVGAVLPLWSLRRQTPRPPPRHSPPHDEPANSAAAWQPRRTGGLHTTIAVFLGIACVAMMVGLQRRLVPRPSRSRSQSRSRIQTWASFPLPIHRRGTSSRISLCPHHLSPTVTESPWGVWTSTWPTPPSPCSARGMPTA